MAADAGSWYSLLNIYAEAATQQPPRAESCPNDGEPYSTGPRGELFCKFDGFKPGGNR